MNTEKRLRAFALATSFAVANILTTVPPAHAADFTNKAVTSISVSGNETVQTDNILAVLKLKAGDSFSAETIKEDMRAIYALNAFYDVQANFIEVPEGITVIYSVIEKKPISSIHFTGNVHITTDQLQTLVADLQGKPIDSETLTAKSQAIEQYYHDQGYILAKVSDIAMNESGNITVSINEGLIESIIVKGNDKTKSNVILRELNFKTQEPFNAKIAKRSMQKIYNLGFFEDVNIKLNPGKAPNAVDVEITVVEKKTGTFSIGGGYSASDGLAAELGLGDSNFKGTGNNVNVSFSHSLSGITGTSWNLSFTNPYIDDKKTSFSVSLFNTVGEYSDYGLNGDNTTLRSTYYRRSRGFNLTLGRPQGDYIKNYITLTKRKDSYLEYVSGPINYLATDETDDTYNSIYNTDYLNNNFGDVHSITLAKVYDTRDNIFAPTEGRRFSLTSEFAGRALGGEFDFNKYVFDGRQYFKVGSKQVLALRVTAGSATGTLPDASKFSIGGIDTLRGYEDDEFKGQKMFTATAEYRYPIVKKVQGVVFTDAGNAWDGSYKLSDLNYSAGTGLRIDTPLGAIRLDYGYGKEGGRTHFSFGTQF